MKDEKSNIARGAGSLSSGKPGKRSLDVHPALSGVRASLQAMGKGRSMSGYWMRDAAWAFAKKYLRLCFVAGRVPLVLGHLALVGVPAQGTHVFGAQSMQDAVMLVVDFEGILAALPDLERFAFAMIALMGLHDWETAKVLGVSTVVIGGAYGRACERICEALQKGGYDIGHKP